MKNRHNDPALEMRRRMEQNNPYSNKSDPVLGKVVAVHADTGTIDVAIDGTPHQGGIIRNVPISTDSFATQTGRVYLPSNIKLAASIPSSSGTYDQPIPSGEQDVWAIIQFLDGRYQRPVCTGFVSPLDSQIHTNDPGYDVYLHESGVWHVVTPSGDLTIGLPDGSTIVVGHSTTPFDMTSQNESWNPQTTDTPYNVTMDIKGDVNIAVNGTATVNASEVYLGTTEGSGQAVARVGDSVNLTTGVIESGSSKVFSG